MTSQPHTPTPPAGLTLRVYNPADAASLLALFRASVEQIASRDYSAPQIRAWVATTRDEERFRQRREAKPTFVAELQGRVAGFSDLEPSGHIDMLYVHPDCQRRGVARALLEHVERSARALQLSRLYTEASLTARPAFAALGFQVIRRETVSVQGQTFVNFQMENRLR